MIDDDHIPGPNWSRRFKWDAYNRERDLRLKKEREMEAELEESRITDLTRVTDAMLEKRLAEERVKAEAAIEPLQIEAGAVKVVDKNSFRDTEIFLTKLRRTREDLTDPLEPFITRM